MVKPGPSGLLLPKATMSSTGEMPGLTTTSSPTARCVTALPIDSMTPAASQPGT
jgi:hypothetical protein